MQMSTRRERKATRSHLLGKRVKKILKAWLGCKKITLFLFVQSIILAERGSSNIRQFTTAT